VLSGSASYYILNLADFWKNNENLLLTSKIQCAILEFHRSAMATYFGKKKCKKVEKSA
jgi:hypothetical protein